MPRIKSGVEQFATQCDGSRDCMVDNFCKTILLEAGVRSPGQHIKVQKGRHSGFIGTIESIIWTEAEVKCKESGRFFSIYHDQTAFTVLDPSQALPPPAARLEGVACTSSSTPLAVSNPTSVVGHPRALPEPEKPSGLSWLPKKKL